MAKNNLLSEQLAYIGVSCTPTHLHLCSYNAESICMQDGKDIDSLIPYLNKNAINWIQIHGFQNTEVIQHVVIRSMYSLSSTGSSSALVWKVLPSPVRSVKGVRQIQHLHLLS